MRLRDGEWFFVYAGVVSAIDGECIGGDDDDVDGLEGCLSLNGVLTDLRWSVEYLKLRGFLRQNE